MGKKGLVTVKAAIAWMVLLCLVVSGCSASNSANNGSAESEQTTIKIAWFSPQPEIFVTPFIDAFEEKHPNIKVDAMISPNYNAYTEKMATAIAGGESFDAVFINTEFGQWAGQGYLGDLTDLVKQENLDLKKEYKDFYMPLQLNDKLYALPYYVTAYATYYNHDLFDEAKVSYPKDNFTWDEYLDIAKKMTKGDGPNKVYGSVNFDWVMTLMLMVNQQGRDMLTATEADIVEALTWKHELTNVAQAQPSVAEKIDAKNNPIIQMKQGKGAMTYLVPATMTQLTEAIKNGEATFKLGMATVPQLPGTTTPKTIGNITSWGIPDKSKHRDSAWTFVRFMTGMETGDMKMTTGFIPANDLGSNDEVFNKFKQLFESDGKVLPEGAKAFFTQEIALELPFDVKTPQLRKLYESEAELALTGGKSIEEAAKTIISKRAELFEK